VQVLQRADVVHRERAGGAARFGVGAEHEVVDEQLAATLEQIERPDLPVGSVEAVVLSDLDHRQRAPSGADHIVVAGELLLTREQFSTRLEPLLTGDDLWVIGHVAAPCPLGTRFRQLRP
jgi:hypothetical protein